MTPICCSPFDLNGRARVYILGESNDVHEFSTDVHRGFDTYDYPCLLVARQLILISS